MKRTGIRRIALGAALMVGALLLSAIFYRRSGPLQPSAEPARWPARRSLGEGGGQAATLELKQGDRVVFLGDGLLEGEQRQGWIELMLTTRFANRVVTFRNLSWSADTPAGDSHIGLSPIQTAHEPPSEGWTQLARQLAEVKPTVVILGYGMASSFAGEAGLPQFQSSYNRLLDTLARISPEVRIELLGPIRHANLGPPWPNPAAHDLELERYSAAVAAIASQRKLRFVSLLDLLGPEPGAAGLTSDGIHLNDAGYRRLAEFLELNWFGSPGSWTTSPQTETLRQAILRKNVWGFDRFRPENLAYLFGYRVRDQGKNAPEVFKFDQLIATEENRIAQLRSLRPVSVSERPLPAATAEIPLTAQHRPVLQIADELEVTLWAETPLLTKPTQINFDPQGRLWVATSEVYPQLKPGQVANDKIVVLEDTTGAGHADKATVFADGLLIPTGVVPGDGGVYVAQSTDLLFFKASAGQEKADVRRTVLTGFGTEDTHHNLHTLRWGPDGRLYLDQSGNTRTNLETPYGVVRVKGASVLRFDPRDERMEVITHGLINPWGHEFDRYGQSFLTDGAGYDGISWIIPGVNFEGHTDFGGHRPRRTLRSISLGSYPKFAGLAVLRSPLFPADWQEDLIACDFRAHRVVRFKLSDQGAGYTTTEMPDLVRSTSDTFRPIEARLGPDGALYLSDWSNPIIQHGEVDFRDPRRDQEHGRIWRIAAKGSSPLRHSDLTQRSNAELLDATLSANGYEQQAARRVLTERGADQVANDLATWTKSQAGNDQAQLSALWLEESFKQIAPALVAALLHSADPGIRAAAVQALPVDGSLAALTALVADENPRVRLEAVRVLGKLHSAAAAVLALSVLKKPMDPALDYALWLTMNELEDPWIAALKSGAWSAAGHEAQLEFGLKAVEPVRAREALTQVLAGKPLPRDGAGPWIELIGNAGGPGLLRQMLDQLLRGEFSGDADVRVLTALRAANRLRESRPSGDLMPLGSFFGSPNEAVRIAAFQLAGSWQLARLSALLLAIGRNPRISSAERAAAFSALRELNDASIAPDLRSLARTAPSVEVRRGAALTLATIDFIPSLPDIIAALKTMSNDADAQLLWRGLIGIHGVSEKLTTALPAAGLPPAVARAGLQPAREGASHQALVASLMKIGGVTLSTVKDTPSEMQTLGERALTRGDAARGERLFRHPELSCTACHAIGGAGGHVGPDLTTIGASAPADYLVESVLFPNAKVKEGYNAVLISTKDGQDVAGLIARESPTEVILRNAANQEVSIPSGNIVKRTDVGSLMPAGLVDSLTPDELLDLIKFLSALGKPGEYDATKPGVARSWKIYQVLVRNLPVGVERVAAGDFTLADWQPLLSEASGAVTADIVKSAIRAKADRQGLYLATQFETAGAQSAIFSLKGSVVGLWVNGVPVKPGPQFTVQTKRGANALVFQLDEGHPPKTLKLTSEQVSFLNP